MRVATPLHSYQPIGMKRVHTGCTLHYEGACLMQGITVGVVDDDGGVVANIGSSWCDCVKLTLGECGDLVSSHGYPTPARQETSRCSQPTYVLSYRGHPLPPQDNTSTGENVINNIYSSE